MLQDRGLLVERRRRVDADRRGRGLAGVDPGHHRRPPRHADRRGEGVHPGRGGDRKDGLDRRGLRAHRAQRVGGRGAPALARAKAAACSVCGTPRSTARPSSASPTRSPATSPTPRSAAPTAPQKHEAAAEWIERLAGERDDKAELLADHYHHALTLREQLGEDTTSLAPKARAAFTEAAHQAAAVYAHPAAARHYHAALTLTPSDDTHKRAALLLGEATALFNAETADEQTLQAAVDAQVAAEEWEAAAKAERMLCVWYEDHEARGEESDAHLAQAARVRGARPTQRGDVPDRRRPSLRPHRLRTRQGGARTCQPDDPNRRAGGP